MVHHWCRQTQTLRSDRGDAVSNRCMLFRVLTSNADTWRCQGCCTKLVNLPVWKQEYGMSDGMSGSLEVVVVCRWRGVGVVGGVSVGEVRVELQATPQRIAMASPS